MEEHIAAAMEEHSAAASEDLQWPKCEDFNCQRGVFSEVQQPTKWGDLPLGVHRIREMKTIETCIGPRMILVLENQEREHAQVWTPQRLREELLRAPGANFINNKGQVVGGGDWDHTLYRVLVLLLSSLLGYWTQSWMGRHSDTVYQHSGTHFADLGRMTG